MHLSELNIYPVKSLKGIALEEAVVEDRGLRYDRRWMLVDENRELITQRELPRMATIRIEVTDTGLIASANGRGSLTIPTRPGTGETADVRVWRNTVPADFYPDEVDGWFRDVLEADCRLVVMPETTHRPIDPDYATRPDDVVSFADGYPFLLIGEGSLADLNSRLAAPVPMNRFRPNLVVAGSTAFEEDRWKRIRIGSTDFHVVKPCARCVLTTVDQVRGEKTGKEPLQTLATYRNRNGNVLFGQNLIAEKPGGVIRVGDEVEVIEKK